MTRSLQLGVVALAAEMDDGVTRLRPRVERDLVEKAGAERAAEDEDDLGVGRQAERRTRLGARARVRRRRDRPADRPVLLPVAPNGQREKDAVGERCGESVREPEVRISLGEGARDPAQTRGEDHRPGDVAAGAEHDVRPPLPQDPKARGRGRKRLRDRAHERETRPPRQPGHSEGVERVAALGDERRLDAVRRAGERHEHAAALERFRDCERRRDVSDRPPGRDQAPQLLLVRHYERC